MQWTRPKSVRQIGEIPGRGRIYMEDYVIRFVKRLAEQSHGMEKAAVLLGASLICDGEKIYQISGVVEIHNFAGRSGPKFTDEDWDYIYSEMKENFTDLEIVGWFYSCQGFSVNQAGQLLQMHKLNFEKRDKVLYLYDETDGEDSFFLYRSGQLEKQKGYYIYYEKNPEMLHYMERENNRHVHIVEQEDDRVVRNIRGIMERKVSDKEKTEGSTYGVWHSGSDCIDCRVCICCADAEPVRAQSGEAAVEYNPDNEPVAPGKSGQDDCRDTESKAYPVSINGSTNTGKYVGAECLANARTFGTCAKWRCTIILFYAII